MALVPCPHFSVILNGPLAAATFVFSSPLRRPLSHSGSSRRPGLQTPGYDAEVPEGTKDGAFARDWRWKDVIMPYWRLFYHLVWATKQREPLIGETEERAIKQSLMMTIGDLGLLARAVGFMPDHVHVVVGIPPKLAVAEVVKRLKGSSSHGVNTLPKWSSHEPGFAWQAEYGAHTVGERGLDTAIDYVLTQKERHAARKIYPALERITH
jgi:putative transposase